MIGDFMWGVAILLTVIVLELALVAICLGDIREELRKR